MKALYENICRGTNRRENLITLRKELKSEEKEAAFRKMTGNRMDEIMKCLVDADPKVRKNAALILGELQCQEAADVLMDAYEEEETLFVRESYVQALSELDCAEYLPRLEERMQELIDAEVSAEEKKHMQSEIHALQELLLDQKGMKKHKFTGINRASEVILFTLPAFRDALAECIPGKKKLLKTGVRTVAEDFEEIGKIRTWQELLFVIHGENGEISAADPKELAEALAASDLMQILRETYQGEAPFYFRIGVAGAMTPAERSAFAKKTAQEIEDAFGRKLINTISHYEIEIRLIRSHDGSFVPMLKLFTLPDHRFDYRKYHVAAGMKPSMAAGLMALAQPYLKEYAQILDPFCGVGTLLMERRFLVPARNAYGIDTFGAAIEKARANSQIAGMQTNYINRDFFKFTHEYTFDEIITDFPDGNLTRPQLDRLYQRFFEKSEEVLAPKGRIILYTREANIVKKQLRLHPQFRLRKEFCVQEKQGTWLYVIELAG